MKRVVASGHESDDGVLFLYLSVVEDGATEIERSTKAFSVGVGAFVLVARLEEALEGCFKNHEYVSVRHKWCSPLHRFLAAASSR